MIKKPPKESEKQIESVDKALSILECFSNSTSKLSLKELSEKTGLYKSRILRLCGTLMTHGFLIRSDEAVYSLGPKLMMLGKVYERTNSLVSLARPVLHELAMLTGESTKLFCDRRHETAVSHQGRRVSSASDMLSTREKRLNCTPEPVARCCWRFPQKNFVIRFWIKKLEKITSTTIIDRTRLEQEFETHSPARVWVLV